MRLGRALVRLVLAGAAGPAFAGPPYLTDDPVPTDTGHWEIYAFTAGEGRRGQADPQAMAARGPADDDPQQHQLVGRGHR